MLHLIYEIGANELMDHLMVSDLHLLWTPITEEQLQERCQLYKKSKIFLLRFEGIR